MSRFLLHFAEAIHFKMQNFTYVTRCVFCTCVSFITVASSPIGSGKCLCVRYGKTRKCENVHGRVRGSGYNARTRNKVQNMKMFTAGCGAPDTMPAPEIKYKHAQGAQKGLKSPKKIYI